MNEQTCTVSGLRLVEAAGEGGLRISKTEYGAVSAQGRSDGENRNGWHRWDTPGLTLYFAHSAQAAFAETIACFRLSTGAQSTLQEMADLFDMSVDELVDVIDDEGGQLGLPPVGVVDSSWRQVRALYTVQLPNAGWWVDPTHAATITAAETTLGAAALHALGVLSGLTLAHVAGAARELTTAVAEQIRDVALQDNSIPLGVRFPSKWGYGTCWAYFSPEDPAALGVVAQQPIDATDPDLLAVAAAFGLRII